MNEIIWIRVILIACNSNRKCGLFWHVKLEWKILFSVNGLSPFVFNSIDYCRFHRRIFESTVYCKIDKAILDSEINGLLQLSVSKFTIDETSARISVYIPVVWSFSRVRVNVFLDFRYSYVISEFELAMNKDIYSYSAEAPNDWNIDADTCTGFINREFTYTQLQQSVDFTVQNGFVYFAVDSAFKYTTMESTVIDGVEHEWGQTVDREKDLPFKLYVPEKTTLTVGVTSNQDDPDPDDFIHDPIQSK
jgi:hypothetical protein